MDAAEALESQLDAVVLVGAQAVYLRTGDADIGVAPYTTDADITIGPDDLADEPLLADLLTAKGFKLHRNPGAWLSADGIIIDIMVPDLLAGPGSRGARLGVHGKEVARRAKGLEGALIDRDQIEIAALDPADPRSVSMNVAGPGALLVAKVIKIAERVGGDRLSDKDALDVLRLLRATETSDLASRISQLQDDSLSAGAAAEAVSRLHPFFGTPDAEGIAMAIRASGVNVDSENLILTMTTLIEDLLSEL
jgi:hypothetical protein